VYTEEGREEVHSPLLLIIQPTSPPKKTGGHIERLSAINTVGLVFPICFPAAVSLRDKLRVASLAYLKMPYPTCLCQHFSVTVQPTPAKFGVNIK